MFISRIIKIFALSVLSVLIFEFVHSELDLITSDQDNHSKHDFCSLVEAASVNKSVDKSADYSKVYFMSDACAYFHQSRIDETFQHLNISPQKYINTNQGIYIINSSLLI